MLATYFHLDPLYVLATNVMADQTFPKEYKLKSRKMIGQIFSDGFVVKSYPIRIQFIFHDIKDFPSFQMGVSVPKRNFKKAVDRNRIKRQIKEAFRLHKIDFFQRLEASNQQIALMIIYSGREKNPYSTIEMNVIKALDKIKF